MDVEVRSLDPGDLTALEDLFSEGGDPIWCFCMSFRIPQRGDREARTAGNRTALRNLVETSTHPSGVVAVEGDRIVGWVSVAPRTEFPRLGRSPVYLPVDGTPVWSIVCFVVSRDRRGRGLMRRLLDGAVELASSNGATILEAYPSDTGDRRVGAGYGYAGFKSLYEGAGFELVATRKQSPSATPRLTMRLDLARSQPESPTRSE